MAAESLGSATVDLIANTGGFERGMDRAERRMRSATKEAAFQGSQLEKLLGQIDPVVAGLGRLDKMEEQLRQHRAANRIDDDALTEYLDKLTQQRNALTRVDDAFGKGATSAKGYNAALRTLPAQFTDIATSIQGGQDLLTVFLQQGGQIKDSFGGIGPALGAVGRYIAGLITPITATGAAIAGLAAVYFDAESDISAFDQALSDGNHTLGLTSDQLRTMSGQVGAAVGDYGDAQQAIIALAQSGKVGATQIQNLGSAITAVTQYSGRSVDDISKAFIDFGDNATQAAQKASEQFGLLTAEQYDVIKALDDQGDHQKALDTLSEDLNANALKRLSDYKESIGGIEGAWDSVKEAIAGAYNGLKQAIDPGIDKQISDLQEIINNRQNGVSLKNIFSANLGNDNVSTATYKAQLDALIKQRAQTQANTQAQDDLNKANQEYIKYSGILEKGLSDTSPEEKKKNALKELHDQYFSLYSAAGRANKDSPLLAGVEYDGQNFSGGSYDARLKKINDDYAKATKQPAYRDDAATRMLETLKQQNAELQAQAALIGNQDGQAAALGDKAKALVAWEQQLADIKSKQTLTADQKSLLANQDKITAQLKSNAELEKEIQLKKESAAESAKLKAFQGNLDAQLSTAQTGLNQNLVGLGMGSVAAQRAQEQARIAQSYQSQQDRLTSDYNKIQNPTQADKDLYRDETAALNDALAQRLGMQQKYYADVDAAQADWTLGAKAAYQDYLQSAADVASQSKSLFSDAFTGMEDAIVQFAKTGKLSFSSFAESVIEDMARIAARQASSSILSSVVSLGSTALSSYFGGGATPGSSAADYSPDIINNWANSLGARATGGLVSPNSMYQVNERGPELYNQDGRSYLMTGSNGGSVTPVSTASGGAGSGGGAGGGGVVVNIAITGDGGAKADSSADGYKSFGDDIGRYVDARYKQLEAKSLSPQGNIRKAINGRA
ncbi:phage tail tape measure protein [Pseudomonas urethralis]|uniref:phage tail tape measure protein n=1 Tax=Pseudomonas urethralis TaxID=2740517 RepID=UPI001596AEB4|nr:phage tail tape measure protein [Pseudomonas urethralis]